MIEITNEDNMKLMARCEDNHFDLAIVDPPYGIGEDGGKGVRTSPSRPNSYLREPKHKAKGWDNVVPNKEYFIELLRVSKNVIIFGANHFIENIPKANSSCWIVWDKKNGGTDFADCELAWSNMKTAVRKYTIHKFDATRGGKDCIHPTQKPVKLYEWLLMNYGKDVDCKNCKGTGETKTNVCTKCNTLGTRPAKILDTHLGSGSIAIACHNLGYDLTACELDKEYYDAAMKRLKQHQAQITIFDVINDK